MKCNATLHGIRCVLAPHGEVIRHVNRTGTVSWLASASKIDGAEVCCGAAERLAGIASDDPKSRALHRPMSVDGRFCRYCGTAWPCRTARAVGIGEVPS